MDPISAAITRAIKAGANDTYSDVPPAVRDEYAAFKGLLAQKFGAQHDIIIAIAELETYPDTSVDPLIKAVKNAKANQDPELVKAAQTLRDRFSTPKSGLEKMSEESASAQPDYPHKKRDFIIGFVGWFVVNGVIWLLLPPQTNKEGGFGGGFLAAPVWLCVFPANVITLIVCAFRYRWVALGIVSAVAVNLVIAAILGLFMNVLCGIPFFTPVK